ncbi:organic cation/carnitine transporter 7 [Plutella xylostella]|uniref:organic cation/carnitine transporter 7 n=1 Tax=Plutella xylostella TaxID=51655 RepID=UPI0020327052|nr:organic cation/carnitine transporter 7 [Plutella xylostella]
MVVGIKTNRANDNIVECENNNIASKCNDKLYSYEEALTLAGHGAYSRRLLLLLSLALLAMGLDMFGFSVAVAGCGCELQLTHRQRGILNSMPFAGPILMSYAWGYISDTAGRRRSLLAAMLGAFSCSALGSFAPNWIVLGVMKLIGTSFGMAACLGVVAARLSALAGVNLLAAGLHVACQSTFATLGLFIFN